MTDVLVSRKLVQEAARIVECYADQWRLAEKLRAALDAKPVEPVAWQISYPNGDCIFTKDINIAEIHRAAGRHVAPLYLHAPAEQDKEAGK